MTSSSSDGLGLLGCLARTGCVVLILCAVGAVWLYWSLSTSMRGPQAVAVPTSWTSRGVTLTTQQPEVRGHITFSLPSEGSKPFALGVNAGVPAAMDSATTGPAALLVVPAVRLTAKGATGPAQSCLAPCELSLSNGSSCASRCSAEFDVAVELLATTGGRGPVSITVTGGASASVGGDVPGIEFAIGGASASGGG